MIQIPGSLLNEKEAAEFLNISVSTMRAWRFQKKNLKFIKLGEKMVRYELSELQNFKCEISITV